MSPNWSVGPIRCVKVSREAEVVAAGVSALTARQHEDGSWGSDHNLDRIVATCHCLMLLLSIGVPPSDQRILSGLQYLTSEPSSKMATSFWRLAPMVGVDGYTHIVEQDLVLLENAIRNNASPSPEQSLVTFIARVYQRLNRTEDCARHLAGIVKEYDPEQAWQGRADATSQALSVICNAGGEYLHQLPSEAYSRSIDLIVLQGVNEGIGMTAWLSRVTSTAYVIMNILESERLISERRLEALIPSAKSYLIACKNDSTSLWNPEEAPFGGTSEITASDYYSAVALRGLVAACSYLQGDFLLQVSYALMDSEAERAKSAVQHAAMMRTRVFLYKTLLLLFIGVFLAFEVIKHIPSLASRLNLSDLVLSRYGSWASIIALTVATISLLYPAGKRLVRWVRSRSPESSSKQ